MAMDVIADPTSIRPEDTVWQDPDKGTYYKPGGGGPYSFFAALASEGDAELITSGTSDHPFIQTMQDRSGGKIHTLHDGELDQYVERYRFLAPYPDFKPEFYMDESGLHRTLYSNRPGFSITPEQVQKAGVRLHPGSTFLVAPVMGEANLELIHYLKQLNGKIIGTIQGWMRATEGGIVISKRLSAEFEDALALHDVVVFSDEDEKQLEPEDRIKLRMLPELAIRTEGVDGCVVYRKEIVDGTPQIRETRLPAFQLDETTNRLLLEDTPESKARQERALTGCGDATGATLALNIARGMPIELAYRDTALVISRKITEAIHGGLGGIEGTPHITNIISYIVGEGANQFDEYAAAIAERVELVNTPPSYHEISPER